MALYEVSRVDTPAPGEFVSGLVLAAGAALARNRFADFHGATKANLTARRVDVAVKGSDVTVLTTVFDESPVLFEDSEVADVFPTGRALYSGEGGAYQDR